MMATKEVPPDEVVRSPEEMLVWLADRKRILIDTIGNLELQALEARKDYSYVNTLEKSLRTALNKQ